MGLIADLVGKVPALAQYRAELDAMESDNQRLRAENAELQRELSQYIEKWETLDGDAINTLRHLARGEFESADAMARAYDMNFQIAEMYLLFLVKHAYVAPPRAGGNSVYGRTHKGRRYLSERGLLQHA